MSSKCTCLCIFSTMEPMKMGVLDKCGVPSKNELRMRGVIDVSYKDCEVS